jgi:inorganic pyrophosphatase
MSNPESFDRWRPHPWHGLDPGRDPPRLLLAYVEITPFDGVKYEIDKKTGYLRVDRPQQTSSLPPMLYGFVPRTLCGPRVAALSPGAARGDGDPMDICVLSERPINRAEVLLDAWVVGGLRMVDWGVADDKIIAVLEGDGIWGRATDLCDLPEQLVDRLRHYFANYKLVPDGEAPVLVHEAYAAEHARQVVAASLEDYDAEYGGGRPGRRPGESVPDVTRPEKRDRTGETGPDARQG